MDQKKILIVSQPFFPDKSPRSLRATELAIEFAKMGHAVTVITPRDGNCHTDFENAHNVMIKDMGNYSWKALKIKGKGIELLTRRLIVRVSNLLFEYPSIQLFFIVKKALQKESGYDLMISIAVPYPIHWGIAAIRSMKKNIATVWVADCGDPYMGSVSDTFKKPFYFKYFEQSFLKRADFIAIPVKEAIVAYYKEFHYKFRVIPQGFSFPDIAVNKKQFPKPVFVYSGNISSYRHYALPFFKFLKSLDIDFEFRIFTITPEIYLDNLKEIAGKLKISTYVDRAVLIQQFFEADFLVHFPYKENKQRSLKLIDYWYARKPVLHFDNTESAKQLLVEFLNNNFTNAAATPPIDEFRISNVCKQFLALNLPDVIIQG